MCYKESPDLVAVGPSWPGPRPLLWAAWSGALVWSVELRSHVGPEPWHWALALGLRYEPWRWALELALELGPDDGLWGWAMELGPSVWP